MATLLDPVDETTTVLHVTKAPRYRRSRFRIDLELVLTLRFIDATHWLVRRGVDGTTPASHDAGATVWLFVPLHGRGDEELPPTEWLTALLRPASERAWCEPDGWDI